jgi:hypothetical protein
VVLNILALVLLMLFGWLFTRLLSLLRPLEAAQGLSFSFSMSNMLNWILMLIGVLVVMIVLHEGLHGLFFWLFSGAAPVFGFKVYYAYASAPGWYFRRLPYMVIGLAPLLLISLAGVLLIMVVPASWLGALLLLVVMNASGAVGDLMAVIWLVFQPKVSLVLDLSESIEVYAPPAG